MLKTFLHISFLGVLTLGTVFSAFAQQPVIETVKSADGVILVRNDKVQRFSFFVSGKNSSDQQNEDGSIRILTGEGGLDVYFFKTAGFLGKNQTLDPAKILEAHRDRDIAAEEKNWQAKLNAKKGYDFVEINDVTNTVFPKKVVSSLFWSYSPPANDGVVLYQTILLGDTILMLRTVFPKTVKIEEVRAFLKKVLESVALLPPAPKRGLVKPSGKKI